MTPAATLTIAPGSHRAPGAITHPNDQDLHLDVRHPPGASVRLETDESAYAGTPIEDGLSRVTIPTEKLRYSIGRMDAELHADGHAMVITLDLLAPPRQAAQVRELVAALVRTPLALLAMPRTHHELEPGGEGERDRVENLKEASRLYSEASQLLAANPPTRVNEIEAETPPGARLTAAIVNAITHQPYALQPATPGPHTLPIRGRHYTPGGVVAAVSTEDTDTPANRFTHGVGFALERLAHEVRSELAREHAALSDTSAPVDGYVTIRQLTRTQAAEATRARLQAVEKVLSEVRLARARLEKRLPVRSPSLGLTTAPRVLLDPRYARVRRTLDLLRAPARDEYGPEGLVAGITSLTTLYELYCLAVLHDQLQAKGYRLTRHAHDPSSGVIGAPHILHDGQQFPNTFTYRHDSRGELTMLYEPRITHQPHPTAGLMCVSAFNAYFTPDVVITTRDRVLILDAKFTPHPPRDLVPEMTIKYLHGLHPTTSDRTLLGLHLLHYGAGSDPLDFHDRPVTPALSTIPVHPHNKTHLSNILDRHLGA